MGNSDGFSFMNGFFSMKAEDELVAKKVYLLVPLLMNRLLFMNGFPE